VTDQYEMSVAEARLIAGATAAGHAYGIEPLRLALRALNREIEELTRQRTADRATIDNLRAVAGLEPVNRWRPQHPDAPVELIGDDVPEHLRNLGGPPSGGRQCTACRRWVTAATAAGTPCRMPQPNGLPCGGVFA